jgi:hypothetical protein
MTDDEDPRHLYRPSDPDTSRDAAISIVPHLSRLYTIICAAIIVHDPNGAISDQVRLTLASVASVFEQSTITARWAEMKRKSLITDNPSEWRRGISTRRQEVRRVTALGRLVGQTFLDQNPQFEKQMRRDSWL